MKKILRAIALLLLPIALYYGVFLAFEKNNYFNLRPTTPSGSVLGALKQYQRHPTSSIIIGDSRVAHLQQELVEQYAGRPFGNLAYGGASLKENIDLLKWWLEQYPNVDEVLFNISFYTLNEEYNYDRIKSIQQSLNNPVAYLTSLSFHFEMLERLRDWLQGAPLDGGENETSDPATYLWMEYTDDATGETTTMRADIAEYLGKIQPVVADWRLNEPEVERLAELIRECTGKGIRFTVVLPPIHPAVRQFVTEPKGIEEAVLPALALLEESGALVLDYEFTTPPDYPEDYYFDGLHLDYERGLPVWTQELFTALR